MTAPAPGDALLTLARLKRSFGGIAAVDDCSLVFQRGSITAIIGPNGAGKTTLVNLISGLVRPDSGSIFFEHHEITGLPPHRVAALGLVRTFQIVRIFKSLTVLENCLLAPGGQSGETLSGALFGRSRMRETERHNATRARAMLERVGLWHLADHPAGGLSGGQKKLLELARALLLDPTMIMLDEPAAGVAQPLLLEIARLLRELQSEGVSFAVVEHDMEFVRAICDRVHVMAEGRPLVSGTFAEVTQDRRVAEAYLGMPA